MNARADTIPVEVAYALPDQQFVVALDLPVGATVADALAAVQRRAPFDRLLEAATPVGVFGELVAPADCQRRVLRPFDRVEFYRPLQQDPKQARRVRAKQDQAAQQQTRREDTRQQRVKPERTRPEQGKD